MENMTFDNYIKVRMNKIENALKDSSFSSYKINESIEEKDYGRFVDIKEKRYIDVDSVGFNVLITLGDVLKEESETNESGDICSTSGFVTNVSGGLQIRLIFICTKKRW